MNPRGVNGVLAVWCSNGAMAKSKKRRREEAAKGEEIAEDDNGDDEEPEEEYEVEKILAQREGKSGLEYCVKWLGWPESENTWEPEDHLIDCKMVMRAWRRQQQKREEEEQKAKQEQKQQAQQQKQQQQQQQQQKQQKQKKQPQGQEQPKQRQKQQTCTELVEQPAATIWKRPPGRPPKEAEWDEQLGKYVSPGNTPKRPMPSNSPSLVEASSKLKAAPSKPAARSAQPKSPTAKKRPAASVSQVAAPAPAAAPKVAAALNVAQKLTPARAHDDPCSTASSDKRVRTSKSADASGGSVAGAGGGGGGGRDSKEAHPECEPQRAGSAAKRPATGGGKASKLPVSAEHPSPQCGAVAKPNAVPVTGTAGAQGQKRSRQSSPKPSPADANGPAAPAPTSAPRLRAVADWSAREEEVPDAGSTKGTAARVPKSGTSARAAGATAHGTARVSQQPALPAWLEHRTDRPACIAHGCPGAGEVASRIHPGEQPCMLACKLCGARWQSRWWHTYLLSRGQVMRTQRLLLSGLCRGAAPRQPAPLMRPLPRSMPRPLP